MADATPLTHITDEEAREVRRLLGRFRRTKPIRVYAEQLLAGGTAPPAEPGLLIRSLDSAAGSRWRERSLAAWAAGVASLTDEETPQVERRLVRLLAERTPPGQVTLRLAVTPGRLAAGLLLTTLWLASHPLGSDRRLMGELLLATVGWLGLLLRAVDSEQASRLRSEAARALGRLRCAAAVGPLADVLAEPTHPARGGERLCARAAEALAQVATSLTPEHYASVPPGTTASLCRLLGCRSTEIGLTALSALASVGDGSAVEPVARLARGARASAVRTEAARVLPILQERRRQEQAPRRLLRPADAPHSAALLLLRPVEGVAPVDPRTLLRPAESTTPDEA